MGSMTTHSRNSIPYQLPSVCMSDSSASQSSKNCSIPAGWPKMSTSPPSSPGLRCRGATTTQQAAKHGIAPGIRGAAAPGCRRWRPRRGARNPTVGAVSRASVAEDLDAPPPSQRPESDRRERLLRSRGVEVGMVSGAVGLRDDRAQLVGDDVVHPAREEGAHRCRRQWRILDLIAQTCGPRTVRARPATRSAATPMIPSGVSMNRFMAAGVWVVATMASTVPNWEFIVP